MTSKLDPQQRARDFRVWQRENRRAYRHELAAGGASRTGGTGSTPTHVDRTTIIYARQLADDSSRFTTLDELPEMDEEWIDEIVYVRSPATGEPDRAFLGIQLDDDTLAWIEISIMAPAPTQDPPPVEVGDPVFTWTENFTPGALSFSAGSMPPGIDADSLGRLWVGSSGNSKLLKLSNAGAVLENIEPPHAIGDQCLIGGVAVAPDDSVYAGDGQQERIWHYSSSGVSLGSWVPDAAIDEPSGVAFNAAGTRIAIADYDDTGTIFGVKVYTWPGLVLTQNTNQGINPTGIDFDSTGNIYISDWTGHCVRTYDGTLTQLDTWGTVGSSGASNAKFNSPAGVHVDAADRVYVCDKLNHRIKVYTTAGVLITTFGELGTGNKKFSSPSDITSFANKLYITDKGNNRISVWTVS